MKYIEAHQLADDYITEYTKELRRGLIEVEYLPILAFFRDPTVPDVIQVALPGGLIVLLEPERFPADFIHEWCRYELRMVRTNRLLLEGYPYTIKTEFDFVRKAEFPVVDDEI
jgi:hypothetical protein